MHQGVNRGARKVSKPLSLRSKVSGGMRIPRHVRGYSFQYLDPGCGDRFDLVRIVRNQPHRADLEKMQDFGSHCVISQVYAVTEAQIRVDCIQTLVLKLIGAQLFHQPYAAPLLAFVHQGSRSLSRNGAQRQFKLIVTVAAQRVEYLARHALRMNPNQGRKIPDVSEHQRQRGLPVFCHTVAVG